MVTVYMLCPVVKEISSDRIMGSTVPSASRYNSSQKHTHANASSGNLSANDLAIYFGSLIMRMFPNKHPKRFPGGKSILIHLLSNLRANKIAFSLCFPVMMKKKSHYERERENGLCTLMLILYQLQIIKFINRLYYALIVVAGPSVQSVNAPECLVNSTDN